MLAIFAFGYVASAAGFYFLVARSAKPIPFPVWVWQQQAEVEAADRLGRSERAA